MKSKFLLPLAASMLALTGSASAGDWSGALYEHNLSVNLTLTSQGAYSRTNAANYTEILKIDTERLSNKEILEALVDDGVITDIRGWSIVLITDDSGEIVGTQIKKRNTPSIDITRFFSAGIETSVTSFTGRFDARKRVYQATGRHMALASATINIDGFFARAQGILNVNYLASGNGMMQGITVQDVSIPVIRQTEIIQNASFTNLTGQYDDNNEEERSLKGADGIITGGLTAGSGTQIQQVQPN